MAAKDKKDRRKLTKSPAPGLSLDQLLLNKTGLQRSGVDFKDTQAVGHDFPCRLALGGPSIILI